MIESEKISIKLASEPNQEIAEIFFPPDIYTGLEKERCKTQPFYGTQLPIYFKADFKCFRTK